MSTRLFVGCAFALIIACGGRVEAEDWHAGPIDIEGATSASSTCHARANVEQLETGVPEMCSFFVTWDCDTVDPMLTIRCDPGVSFESTCDWHPNIDAWGDTLSYEQCSCTDVASTIAQALQQCGTESK